MSNEEIYLLYCSGISIGVIASRLQRKEKLLPSEALVKVELAVIQGEQQRKKLL